MGVFSFSRFPELYASLNTEMPEGVIWDVLMNDISVDEAMERVIDEYDEMGLEEPEWMEELDFNDTEKVQEAINDELGITMGNEFDQPVVVMPDVAEKLKDLAEVVELTIDDPTDLDEFEILYDDVQSAMGKIADDDVDKIMNLIDSTDDFQVVADTIMRAERAAMIDGTVDDDDIVDDFIDDILDDDDKDLLPLLTQNANRYGDYDATTPFGAMVMHAVDNKDLTLEQAAKWAEDQLIDFPNQPSGGEFWMPDDLIDESDPGGGQGAYDHRDATDAVWTEYFDEVRARFQVSLGTEYARGVPTYSEFIIDDLSKRFAEAETSGASGPYTTSLFQWALDRAGSGRLDEDTYNAIRDALTGGPIAQAVSDYAKDWRNAIAEYGDANLEQWMIPPEEYEAGEDLWLSEYIGSSPIWEYPTYEVAQKGFDAETTLAPGGAYFAALIDSSGDEQERFDDAWRDAFPNRSMLVDENLRTDMLADARMASIVGGDTGYWDPTQEKYAGYKPTGKARYDVDPFTPSQEWYNDFIKNASAHRTSLYQNAVVFADFLHKGAWQAEGEDYTRYDSDWEKVALNLGFDLSDDEGYRTFNRWILFNPFLWGKDSDEAEKAAANIVQLGVSALTPVNAGRKVRSAWKDTVQAKYDAWVTPRPEDGYEGQNPNSFLKDLFEKQGRVVGQRSTVGQQAGATRMGSITPSGYQERFTQPGW